MVGPLSSGGPHRVRLRRARGWRKPDGAVVVARPTRWGNPERMGGDRRASAEWFAAQMALRSACQLPPEHPLASYPSDAEIRAELAGRDLACWCPLDQPCHADTLLAIANGDGVRWGRG